MTLVQLKADYVEMRDRAEEARGLFLRTGNIHFVTNARSARKRARSIQQEIRKIEDRILIEKGK